MASLEDMRVVLAVTGGIAAYKAAELCSQLRKAGAEVRVAMTRSATRFVAPLTFETLTQYPVYLSIFAQPKSWEMEHISWAKWGDVLVVAPASANTIAKMANGIADDAVSTLYLSFRGRTLVAPAMNTAMLDHPATVHNLQVLRQRGVAIVEPQTGMLACGDEGAGKLAAVEEIVSRLREMDLSSSADRAQQVHDEHAAVGDNGHDSDALMQKPQTSVQAAIRGLAGAEYADRDDTLAGRVVLVTSGPTHEYLDPVRFLTNPSSGKMGAALAREAARRGATVHLVSGPVAASSLPSEAAKIHKVITAEQMLRTVRSLADEVNIFIFAAAVSDFRVANPPSQKIKRTGNTISLPLVENPDIAQAIGYAKRPGQVTIGFAAETSDLETNAVGKMQRKHLDAIVANNVADSRIGFDRDDNEVTVFLCDGQQVTISRRPKSEVARQIFEAILPMVKAQQPTS